ncbi:hypothetical protein PHYBLDRAFT_167636 [Phycomyces blakesleeanus NRRL 1555(-)]|uniref:Uncharacterized protein n=1 Tax=Phycomyces blakesleeanus (strain ATCC 8743b / DSM 1359 / FGSC 10004 / NBRC 33097 / NRRL 1555) TaxID=763407 RepID=A0A163AKW1_PHYB8|nr:hypothetical protein PHYBLDRAFT_167636 [Phycomyces blakesleeanus NRRL 1555(-)]OAD74211.1 hypothetical protein PHYBLDRAFT_167636 [Phycomyces blakesleeanus NRRL 1555(-)]|eukprot:XP_018292251.1 hypothetical protein PHYBLDRAFT_167636 [Phycomyces blakesleeanus NRRL 1555(-)]
MQAFVNLNPRTWWKWHFSRRDRYSCRIKDMPLFESEKLLLGGYRINQPCGGNIGSACLSKKKGYKCYSISPMLCCSITCAKIPVLLTSQHWFTLVPLKWTDKEVDIELNKWFSLELGCFILCGDKLKTLAVTYRLFHRSKYTHNGTRTRNLRFRRPMRYPLRHVGLTVGPDTKINRKKYCSLDDNKNHVALIKAQIGLIT